MPAITPIVIVEDHELFGEGLRSLLNGPEFVVRAIVVDGDEAVSVVRRHQPRVILLDLGLPGRSGLSILADLRESFPSVAILILTMHCDAVLAAAVVKRGASGFMTKDSSIDELRKAIRIVASGGQYIGRAVVGASKASSAAPSASVCRLTPRQQSILQMIGLGMETEAIAESLGVSIHTVHFHRRNIHTTLGLETELDLVRYATLLVLTNS